MILEVVLRWEREEFSHWAQPFSLIPEIPDNIRLSQTVVLLKKEEPFPGTHPSLCDPNTGEKKNYNNKPSGFAVN